MKKVKPLITEEPILLLEEVKIQSVVDEKKQKEWIREHIKNPPPLNVPEEARKNALDKIHQIKQLKTNPKTHQLL